MYTGYIRAALGFVVRVVRVMGCTGNGLYGVVCTGLYILACIYGVVRTG